MKLGSLKSGRDGQLIVVSRDLSRLVAVPHIAQTLQQALDNWSATSPQLVAVATALEATALGHTLAGQTVQALDLQQLASPLPRAFEFLDGSAYLPHVERVRRARGADMPPSFYTDPLMYQGTAASFYGPTDPILCRDAAWGIDLEAEVVVVCTDLPQGATPDQCLAAVVLVGLVNDVSLRNLIPAELAKGFGFLQSKPRSALSPVLCTPDELTPFWQGGRLHRAMRTWINDQWFGHAEAGEDMQFHFGELLAHAAKTRPLMTGTILGSGTVANEDTSRGASCLAEQRTVETLTLGAAKTPFLQFGDVVKIDMWDDAGHSLFGAIEQRVEQAP